MAKNHRMRHTPKLTAEQVLEMRERVQPGGDLHGRSPKTVGRQYRVSPAEATKALAGIVSYEGFPQEGKITDISYLRSSTPGKSISGEQRRLYSGGDMLTDVEQPKRRRGRGKASDFLLPSEVDRIREMWVTGYRLQEIVDTVRTSQSTTMRVIYGHGRYSYLPSLAGASPHSRGPARAKYLREHPNGPDVGQFIDHKPDPDREEDWPPGTWPHPEEQPATLTYPALPLAQVDAGAVLQTMLQLIPPQALGLIRKPEGKEIGDIIQDLHAGYALLGSAIEELQRWLDQYHAAQQPQQPNGPA